MAAINEPIPLKFCNPSIQSVPSQTHLFDWFLYPAAKIWCKWTQHHARIAVNVECLSSRHNCLKCIQSLWGEIGGHWVGRGCIGEYGLATPDMAYPPICLPIHSHMYFCIFNYILLCFKNYISVSKLHLSQFQNCAYNNIFLVVCKKKVENMVCGVGCGWSSIPSIHKCIFVFVFLSVETLYVFQFLPVFYYMYYKCLYVCQKYILENMESDVGNKYGLVHPYTKTSPKHNLESFSHLSIFSPLYRNATEC